MSAAGPGMEFSIRPATVGDADAIARVHGQSWDESYRGLLPDEIIDRQMAPTGFLASWRARLENFDPTEPTVGHVFVATVAAEQAPETGGLIGFVAAGTSRDEGNGCLGEIRALYLLQAFQRHGIGKALWNAGVEDLASRGLLPGHVVTLVENPTVKFYERMGAVEFVRTTCRHSWAQHLEEVSLRFDRPCP